MCSPCEKRATRYDRRRTRDRLAALAERREHRHVPGDDVLEVDLVAGVALVADHDRGASSRPPCARP